jgi:hypothetical protein
MPFIECHTVFGDKNIPHLTGKYVSDFLDNFFQIKFKIGSAIYPSMSVEAIHVTMSLSFTA